MLVIQLFLEKNQLNWNFKTSDNQIEFKHFKIFVFICENRQHQALVRIIYVVGRVKRSCCFTTALNGSVYLVCLPSPGAWRRSGPLCADWPISLWGSPVASVEITTQKKHENIDPCRRGFCLAVLLLWIGLLYLVLSVGHGAIERPLLKLQVVHIQLLCEHAAWRHSDLAGDSMYPMLSIRHDIKDTHRVSLLSCRGLAVKSIFDAADLCLVIFWHDGCFFSVKTQPTTLGSSTFVSAGINALVRMYVPEKNKEAQRLVQQWLPAIDDNPNSIISACWV